MYHGNRKSETKVNHEYMSIFLIILINGINRNVSQYSNSISILITIVILLSKIVKLMKVIKNCNLNMK